LNEERNISKVTCPSGNEILVYIHALSKDALETCSVLV
jgi:hypothetical protein